MLLWIILLFFVDYVFQYDFRQAQWMVISYVMFDFAGMGGDPGCFIGGACVDNIFSNSFLCRCNTCFCAESRHRFLI